MHKVSIKPQWSIQQPDGQILAPRVLELLTQVHENGSLSGACKVNGTSYRHAWDLIRQGEQQLGAPLLLMERGKGSRLTPLGEKLVWASHRIAARLAPILDTLASELEVEIERVLTREPNLLRIHASHGFAIEKLLDRLALFHLPIERKYMGGQEALASLQKGACDLAGFHIPVGTFANAALDHYAESINFKTARIIHVATRRQGLMVAPGNPKKIYDVSDLLRPEVRFVNRQRGAGTRFLLDKLLEQAGLNPSKIAKFENGEYTHSAVAAFVASGMADVGFGVETPARRFKLDFIPIASERYFLIGDAAMLDTPLFKVLLETLRSPSFQDEVNQLPGYTPEDCGWVETFEEAYPGYSRKKGKA